MPEFSKYHRLQKMYYIMVIWHWFALLSILTVHILKNLTSITIFWKRLNRKMAAAQQNCRSQFSILFHCTLFLHDIRTFMCDYSNINWNCQFSDLSLQCSIHYYSRPHVVGEIYFSECSLDSQCSFRASVIWFELGPKMSQVNYIHFQL